MTTNNTAQKLQQDIDNLVDDYKRVTTVLVNALDANTPQKDRDELRRIFTPLIQSTGKASQPGPGGARIP